MVSAALGLGAATFLVACGSSALSGASQSGRQFQLMESINRSRQALLAGDLWYSNLAQVRAGSTEQFHARLIALDRRPLGLRRIMVRYYHQLRVGGVEGATLSAPDGGVAITAIGPTTGLIGKPGDEVDWTWSLKATQPGTYPVDLVVVTYQGETHNPLYTMNPPLTLKLVVTTGPRHLPHPSTTKHQLPVKNDLLGGAKYVLSIVLATVVGTVTRTIIKKRTKKSKKKAGKPVPEPVRDERPKGDAAPAPK
jgi:hypothetical protein